MNALVAAVPGALMHAVTSTAARYSYGTRTTEQVMVTIEDDETPGVVSRLRLAVQEYLNVRGGTNRHGGTYTMVLDSAIGGTGAAVGVSVFSPDRDVVGDRAAAIPYSGRENEWPLVFTPSNWNMPQRDDKSVTLTHTAVGGETIRPLAGDNERNGRRPAGAVGECAGAGGGRERGGIDEHGAADHRAGRSGDGGDRGHGE